MTDGASNNKLAFRDSEEFEHLWCVLHKLQLAVKDSVNDSAVGSVKTKKVVAKCNKLAVKVRKSPEKTRELKEACRRLGIKFKTLKKANATRWNSVLMNMQSLDDVEKALKHLAMEDSDFWRDRGLLTEEWKMVKGMIRVLEKVRVITKCLEAEKNSTSNLVISLLFDLKVYLEAFEKNKENDRQFHLILIVFFYCCFQVL